MSLPPPPYTVQDPMGNWPLTIRAEFILHTRTAPSDPRRNGIDLERRDDPSRPRRHAIDLGRRTLSSQPRRNAFGRAPTAPAQRTVASRIPRPTLRGAAPAPPADLQWSILTSVKPAAPLAPVYLFSARDMSTPTTWHFGYGSAPTAPEHVLSCRGPKLGSMRCATSLDPLQYRYDHIESCYAAHSRVEKLLRAYLKHRAESGCGCSLAAYTGLGLTVDEDRCEKIWGSGFRAFFRSQKVRRLIDGHDECCSCGCLGKRKVQYVGDERLGQVEPPAWCIYGFIPRE